MRRTSLFANLRALHQSCNPSCLVRTCKRPRCQLRLPQEAMAMDCDRCRAFPQHKKHPDFIVLHANASAHWFVVEMKSKVSNVSDIIEQLEAGAKAILSSRLFKVGIPPDIAFIVLHRGIHQQDQQALQRRRLRVNGVPVKGILVKRCGISLTQFLEHGTY